MEANRVAYGKALAELGRMHENIVVLDADLGKATNTIKFRDVAPERYLDCGIAEQNMMGIAAGLATTGKTVFASTFAVFASMRALEQVRNSICYPNLNVKVVATHAGIESGGDGASHQSVEDIATMRSLPNMKVFVPSDHVSTAKLVSLMKDTYGPMYMRVGRDANEALYKADETFSVGGSKQLTSGNYATVIACGTMVYKALTAAKELAKEHIDVRVIDMYSIKPLDEAAVLRAARETKGIITIEDHSVIGGLGSAVCEIVAGSSPARVIRLGVKDQFGRSGLAEELFTYYGLTPQALMEAVKSL